MQQGLAEMRFRVVWIQLNRLVVTRKGGGGGPMERLLGDTAIIMGDGIVRIDLDGLLKIA